MTTLATLTTKLFGADGSQGIIQDSSFYSEATSRINAAVTAIAGGIRMPDGRFSPPLPELYESDTITTSTTLPYVALPSTYQRDLFMVADSNGYQLYPPNGGDYYTFHLFMRRALKKDLSQTGAISMVCVKGLNLYYQGIPTAAKTLTLQFYRAPVAMSVSSSEPDGLPAHLADRLIEHYVAKEIFGSYVEDGDNNQATGFKYHTARFYEAMTDLLDFLPDEGEPSYYGSSSFTDMGICD